jgi:hemoglobin/transferrin/lactoferrin receptor protein
MNKVITFLLILFTATSFAQQVRVISKSDLQPVSKCSISNSDKTISITTDNSGRADLSKFKSTDKLIFTHISFVTAEYDKSFFTAKTTDIELTVAVINLKEVVLSANKVEEKYSDLAMKIDILPARQIQFSNSQTAGDLLQQSGKIFVQQSQLGGGSPVIRGMESSRVLIVVDGIRMNNAIYRAGHLQNVITIDPNSLTRVEVVHGPGSVIYGSDAMGGVMHFYTRNPILSETTKVFTSGNAMLRYSSAANEFSQSYILNIGGKKLSAIFGGSTKKIGDLREGNNRDSKYGDWGKCLYYAERINGVDVMSSNSEPLIQKNSGYNQYDFFTKALYKPSKNNALTLNMQYSNSGNIPRYDRLTELSGGQLKYAEWYYGPQIRGLVSLKAEWLKPVKLYDNMQVLVAYQYIGEERISRGFGKSKTKHQEETVQILSMNTDFMKKIYKRSELRYGFEANINLVGSKAYNQNVNTGEITYDAASRYPDGGDQMTTISGYASNNWEISEKLIFSQGLRLSYVGLEAEYTPEMMEIIQFPIESQITQDNTAINGSLGLVFMPGNGWRLATNLSSGFRAPNIDDLSKINDSNSTDQLIIVPNPELKPEYAYSSEITIGKTFDENVQLELTGFYTLLKDAFVARPYQYNGQDSIEFEGTLCAVQALQNAERATIFGFEGNVTAKLTSWLSFRSSLTYTYGRVKTEDVPLDHIPPMFGLTSFKVEASRFTGELYSRYNAWKHIEDYSPSGEDNEAYATVDGMPSWFTINLRAGYQFNRYLNLQAGIENILDRHYRNFASGISAPGRNIFVTLRANL